MIDRRPATNDDKVFLKALFRQVYEDVVVEQFGQWDSTFFDQHFEQLWPDHGYEIIELDNVSIGAIWLSAEPGHLWLREIQIHPNHQNRGIGKQLLLEIIEQANADNLTLRLRVLEVNRAQQLYRRLGFQLTGERNETHVWMERKSL